MDSTLIVAGVLLFFAYRRYGKPLPSKDKFTEPMPIGRNLATFGAGAQNKAATYMATSAVEFQTMVLANKGYAFKK
jgi:hypothetical protein